MIYNKDERKTQIWLNGAHFINDIYTGFLNPIMPFIAEQVKISMPIATIILSCSHIFSSLLQPYFGFFADKMRKRALIFWGLLFTSIFISLVPASDNIAFMILFIVLGSLGSSLFHPQSLGFVVKFSTSDVARNMGIFIAMGTLGYSMGPLLSSTIAQYLGLDKMPILAILGILWAILMFSCVPKFSHIKAPKSELKLGQALKKVYRGEIDITDSVNLAKQEISKVFDRPQMPAETDTYTGNYGDVVGKCPLCDKEIVRGKYNYGCRGYKDGCKFSVSLNICSRNISVSNVKLLIETGRTSKIQGFVSQRTGKTFDAVLKLADGKAVFDFSN